MPGTADPRCRRGHIDDRAPGAPVTGRHAAHGFPGTEERPDAVHGEHPLEAIDGHLVDTTAAVDDAGIVHQGCDRSKIGGGLEERAHRWRRPHIERSGEGGGAGLLALPDDGARPRRRPGSRQHGPSPPRQCHGGGGADPRLPPATRRRPSCCELSGDGATARSPRRRPEPATGRSGLPIAAAPRRSPPAAFPAGGSGIRFRLPVHRSPHQGRARLRRIEPNDRTEPTCSVCIPIELQSATASSATMRSEKSVPCSTSALPSRTKVAWSSTPPPRPDRSAPSIPRRCPGPPQPPGGTGHGEDDRRSWGNPSRSTIRRNGSRRRGRAVADVGRTPLPEPSFNFLSKGE